MAFLRRLDGNLEKTVILVSYVAMAGTMFVEVIRRFLFNEQAARSSTIPIYRFLWVIWIGRAFNEKIRAHLTFDEIRTRVSYNAQYALLILDAVLCIGFAFVVIYYSTEQVMMARDNFAIVHGTGDILQWWFYLAMPLACALPVLRVAQNAFVDWCDLRNRKSFRIRTRMSGD